MAKRIHITETTESELLARLAVCGMRLESFGETYRLMYGNTILLARGPAGFGLTLEEIELFTRRALRQ
jgi:hypothetical protein